MDLVTGEVKGCEVLSEVIIESRMKRKSTYTSHPSPSSFPHVFFIL